MKPAIHTFEEIKSIINQKSKEYNVEWLILDKYEDEEYLPVKTKITIYCKKHKTQKTFSIGDLLRGRPICNDCRKEERNREYYKRLKQYCDKLGYVLIEKDFISAKHPIHYICPNHPNIIQESCYDVLIHNHKCPLCALKENGEKRRVSEEDIKEELNKRNLDLEKIERKDNTTWIYYRCRKHTQKVRKIQLSNFLNGGGCPLCKESHGERAIRVFLEGHNIKYETQKEIKGCKDIHNLRFDFYLSQYNLCIEFQGKQHYNPSFFISIKKDEEKGLQDFKKLQKRDEIKRQFCKENGIKLLEITYKEEKKIDEILSKYLLGDKNEAKL